MKLKDKVAVITGGTSGIGLAIARAFAREGAKVTIAGRTAAPQVAQELGPEAHAVECDVTRVADLERLFAEVAQRHGRVDVVVANAGRNAMAPVEYIDEATFDMLMDTNIKGVFFTVQKALPLMQAGGSIILMASAMHQRGFAMTAVYSATKAAVRSFARSLAAELTPKQIRVNAISPGAIDTPLYDKLGMPPEQVAGMKEAFAKQIPVGKLGMVEDVAAGAVYLASDDSRYCTGSDLSIDGGVGHL
jgi:NAD(P)-dependent dehydrogenase (short-subunit alcohol dehydrogenase family)